MIKPCVLACVLVLSACAGSGVNPIAPDTSAREFPLPPSVAFPAESSPSVTIVGVASTAVAFPIESGELRWTHSDDDKVSTTTIHDSGPETIRFIAIMFYCDEAGLSRCTDDGEPLKLLQGNAKLVKDGIPPHTKDMVVKYDIEPKRSCGSWQWDISLRVGPKNTRVNIKGSSGSGSKDCVDPLKPPPTIPKTPPPPAGPPPPPPPTTPTPTPSPVPPKQPPTSPPTLVCDPNRTVTSWDIYRRGNDATFSFTVDDDYIGTMIYIMVYAFDDYYNQTRLAQKGVIATAGRNVFSLTIPPHQFRYLQADLACQPGPAILTDDVPGVIGGIVWEN